MQRLKMDSTAHFGCALLGFAEHGAGVRFGSLAVHFPCQNLFLFLDPRVGWKGPWKHVKLEPIGKKDHALTTDHTIGKIGKKAWPD